MPALVAASVAVVLMLVLAAYAGIAAARRQRVKAAADALGGEYFPDAGFGPGRIVGPRYTIRVAALRRSFFTDVDVRAGDTPGHFVIDAPFFEAWPDWAHVKVRGTTSMRAFVVELSLPGYRPPTEAERQALWRWLHRGSTERRLESNLLAAAQVRRITIGDGAVATFFSGTVTDAARLRSTLDLLGRLASDGRRPSVGEVS
jgi:hypothetical protein